GLLAHPHPLRRFALAGQANGVNLALPPKLQEHQAVAVDRAGNDLPVVRPLAFTVAPEFGVGLGVKCREAVLARNQQVLLPVMLHQEWGRMSGANGPILLPAERSSLLVEADQEAGTFVVIPGEK